MAKNSKHIIIDASVAMAAGQVNAVSSRSKSCRDFLITFRSTSHQVVFNTAIAEEWDKHQSPFARTWRASMVSRKRMYRVDTVIYDALRNKIESIASNENTHFAMLKDIHLIEAALVADRIVVSLDEAVRKLFEEAARKVSELRNIIWINPCKDDEQVISWLEKGAKSEMKRLIGYQTRFEEK